MRRLCLIPIGKVQLIQAVSDPLLAERPLNKIHELVPVANKRPKRAAAAILPQYSADRPSTSLVNSWDLKIRSLELWQSIRRGFAGLRLPFDLSLLL